MSVNVHLRKRLNCHRISFVGFLVSIGLFDLKMKYDESDNIFIRATRTVTDKFADIFREYIRNVFYSYVLYVSASACLSLKQTHSKLRRQILRETFSS